MKLSITRDPNSVKPEYGRIYGGGPDVEEYYFDETIAEHLKADGFLPEMRKRFCTLLDWGTCDYFEVERCAALLDWVKVKLDNELSTELREFYTILRIFAEKGIRYGTGLDFDF